jgi:hypothetical protein
MNKHLKIGLAALAFVGAPLTYNVVMAQQTGTTSVVQQATDYSKVFLQKLASALGIDQAKLETALKSASNATVDQALTAQDITKAQADQWRSRIDQGNYGLWGRGGPGKGGPRDGMSGPGGRGGMGGIGISQISLMDSAAKALGISIVELDTALRGGQTLIALATAKNVSLETVKNAVVTNLKAQLAQAVTAGTLTQARADEIVTRVQSDPNFGLRGGRGMKR